MTLLLFIAGVYLAMVLWSGGALLIARRGNADLAVAGVEITAGQIVGLSFLQPWTGAVFTGYVLYGLFIGYTRGRDLGPGSSDSVAHTRADHAVADYALAAALTARPRNMQIGFIGCCSINAIPVDGTPIDLTTKIGRPTTPNRFFMQQFLTATDAEGQTAKHNAPSPDDVVLLTVDGAAGTVLLFPTPQAPDLRHAPGRTVDSFSTKGWPDIPGGDCTFHCRVMPTIIDRLVWKTPPQAPVKYEITLTAQVMGHVVEPVK